MNFIQPLQYRVVPQKCLLALFLLGYGLFPAIIWGADIETLPLIRLPGAWGHLLSTPLTTENKASLFPALLTAGTLFMLDASLQPSLEQDLYPWLNSGYYFSASIPDFLIGETPLIAYQYAMAMGDSKLQRTGLAMGDAVVSALILAQSFKHLTGRARPVEGGNPAEWWHWTSERFGKNTAFPSLHATTYSAAATVIGLMYDAEWPAYAVCLAMFVGDMNSHHHWVSDMVMGAWLGRVIGEHWVGEYQQKTLSSEHWQISPYVSPFSQLDLALRVTCTL